MRLHDIAPEAPLSATQARRRRHGAIVGKPSTVKSLTSLELGDPILHRASLEDC